jgi:hypothetical protein
MCSVSVSHFLSTTTSYRHGATTAQKLRYEPMSVEGEGGSRCVHMHDSRAHAAVHIMRACVSSFQQTRSVGFRARRTSADHCRQVCMPLFERGLSPDRCIRTSRCMYGSVRLRNNCNTEILFFLRETLKYY